VDDGRPDSELSPEECIRAGMYWFGRNDFEAAQSWWNKALEVDPANTRARECLELLQQTSVTGFKSTTWSRGREPSTSSPFVNPRAPEASRRPYLEAEVAAAPPPPPASDPVVEPDEPVGFDIDIEPASEADTDALAASQLGSRPGPNRGRIYEVSSPAMTTDPLDFASEGSRFAQGSEPSSPTPWDDGPAKTSVVTVETDDFDAVAEQTPLPELDRDEYFDRYPRSRREIVDYLRATGDLPPDLHDSEDVLDPDEPVPDEPSPEDSSDPIEIARNKFQLHDFDGVIDTLESLDTDHPSAAEATRLIAEARAQLLKMYESKIGDFGQTPRLLVSAEEVIWLNLNHRAGFILSQIDGTVTFDDLISLSGMSRLDTVKILAELIGQRVIAV
jgi:hypothetical protein